MSTISKQKISILHVDDDRSIGDLTQTFLKREDDRFAIETVTSADEGLQRISDRLPDCVVSDYNMPGMDGIEFLQAVREQYPDLPFILFTGKGSETVASDAIAAGITDYLQKGPGSEQYELLANRIRNAVQARRESRRADRQEQLMRLTEFAGDTGGFELHAETGEMLLTDGIRRLIDLPAQADLTLDEALNLYHPEDREDIRQTIDQARQTGERTHGTWRLQAQDGDERIVDVTVTPANTGGTEILRGSVHDITDQHERQQELKKERRFITQALDALDDIFYVLNTDGTLRRWNDRTPEVTGYAEQDLADMQAIELFPEDDRQTIATALETALEDGRTTVEADMLTADSERLPYEFTGARLTDDSGKMTGLVGIGRDLTERRQRDRRFRALVEESNDVISILDTDGRYQYQSPSIERILGYNPEETVSDTAWEYIHPDDRETVIEEFETWVANPEKRGEVVEYRARDADGSWRWMEAKGNNQFDNPAVEGYVVNSRDITEHKERERELQRTTDLMSNMEQLADVGAWEYDSETETLLITDGTRRIYGLEPGADLSLEETFEYFHPEDRDRLTDRFSECLKTGEPYEIDLRLTTTEGTQRWITARGERVDTSGSDSVVRGYIQDITEEKTRERRLTELNQALQGLLTAKTRQEVAEIGVEAASDILEFQANAIHISDAGDTRLVPVAQTDKLASLIGDTQPLPVADSIAGRVYQNGEPAVITDVKQDLDAHDPETDLGGHLYLPLDDHGILIAGSEKQAAFNQQDLTFGKLLAGNLVAALDRVEREQTARQRREELSLFFEESPLGAVQWDDEFEFERVNRRAEEILGYSEAELRGNSWEMIVAEEDRGQVGDVVEGLLAADGGTDVINGNVRKDGEVLTCEWHNRAVTNDSGDVQSVFSKFQDVTDRENRKQELQRIRNQYQTLAENFPNGAVFMFDENLQYIRAGGGELESVGTTPDEIEGATAHDIFPKQLADELTQYYNDALEGNSHAFRHTIGDETYQTWTVPVQCSDEDINYGMGMSQNITDQIERRQELERQNKRLEEFASIVSHDLRSPLSVVDGHLKLAQETCESDHLAEAADALNRSQALIDNLLKLTWKGETVSEIEPVDLADVAEDSWQTVETGSATLEIIATGTLRADRSRLQELFENLYRNAVEHSGENVTVSVGMMEDGFYVADSGPGVPESERQEVFEAGYSTTEGGTGLGLWIVKQITDAHEWEVNVTDSEKDGVGFEITGVEEAG